MMKLWRFAAVTTVVTVGMIWALTVDAGDRLHRLSGHWWGDGYHVCNPGPNSSYYCPWSALNTPRPEQLAPPAANCEKPPGTGVGRLSNSFGRRPSAADYMRAGYQEPTTNGFGWPQRRR